MRSTWLRYLGLFVVAGLLNMGSVAQAENLTVSAAASLTDAFKELQAVFQKAHPKVTVHMNFAASNPLLKQIQEGAPVDVFATADQATMDKAAQAKLINTKSRCNFACNGLVMIVPKDAKQSPATAADLKDAKFTRIAVGSPASVPAGRYAKESLESQKLWTDLQPKFIFGENVRQVLDYVARGEVDAGFVYTTDAYKAKEKVNIAKVMEGHTPVQYPIAIVAGSKNPNEAELFMKLVLSDEGQKILQKYGFKSAK